MRISDFQGRAFGQGGHPERYERVVCHDPMLTEGACGGKAEAFGGKAGALEGSLGARQGIAEDEPAGDEPEGERCWDGGMGAAVAGDIGCPITSSWTGMTKSAAAAI